MGLVFNLIPLKTTEKEKGRRFRILFRAMIYSRKAGAEGVSFKNKMKKKKRMAAEKPLLHSWKSKGYYIYTRELL